MAVNKVYTVSYLEYQGSKESYICVLAPSKADAYDKAVYEEIPRLIGSQPYAAWVSSVTYNNGNYKEFNTFPGNPY